MKQLSTKEIQQMKAAARALGLPIRRAPPIQLLRLALKIGTQVGTQTQFALQTLPHGWALERDCFNAKAAYAVHSTACSTTIPCLTRTIVPATVNLPSLWAVTQRNPLARTAVAYNAPGGTRSSETGAWFKRGCGTPAVPDITWPVESPTRRPLRVRTLPLSLPPLAPALDPNIARAIPRRLNPFGGVDIDTRRREAEDLDRARRQRPPGRFRVVWPGTPGRGGPIVEVPRGTLPPVTRLKPGIQTRPAPGPIAPNRRPGERVKEIKGGGPKKVADRIWGALDKASEFCDAIDSIFKALPEDLQKSLDKEFKAAIRNSARSQAWERKFLAETPYSDEFTDRQIDALNPFLNGDADKIGGQYAVGGCYDKAEALYRNWDQVDIATAVENLIYNEVEDKVIGRMSAALQNAVGAQNAQKLVRAVKTAGSYAGGPAADLAPYVAVQLNNGYQYARRKASDAWKRSSR